MANKGKIYETKLNRLLKSKKVQSRGFTNIESGDSIDTELVIAKKTYNVEIKFSEGNSIEKIDFGQLAVVYDMKSKQWIYGQDRNNSAPIFDKMNSLAWVNSKDGWGDLGAPLKWIKGKDYTRDDFNSDQNKFGDRFLEIPDGIKRINDYYHKRKGVDYIQIGGGKFGLYHFGSKCPANIGTPRFPSTGKAILKLRFKNGSKDTAYSSAGFTLVLKMPSSSGLVESDRNLEDLDFLAYLSKIK